jgi:hypothetical protein
VTRTQRSLEKLEPGRPRKLIFEEMVAKGLVKPLGARNIKNNERGIPQSNKNVLASNIIILNNLRSLKRLTRLQMRRE